MTMILAIRRDALSVPPDVVGLIPISTDRAILAAMPPESLWLGPRHRLETDEAFLQLIPYVVLRNGNCVLRYRRGESGNEARLHARHSIGLGGHVDFHDVVWKSEGVDLLKTLDAGADREVHEEVGDVVSVSRRRLGLLLDSSTKVSRVHLGVLSIWDVAARTTKALESSIDAQEWVDLETAVADANLETWSAIAVSALTSD